jgi:hypothetical protein
MSTYFARIFANLPNLIEGFYQTFLIALKEDRPLADLQVDIKDKAVAELVRCLETCCSLECLLTPVQLRSRITPA